MKNFRFRFYLYPNNWKGEKSIISAKPAYRYDWLQTRISNETKMDNTAGATILAMNNQCNFDLDVSTYRYNAHIVYHQ